jgi:dTDP-3-amino-2,3,6-trideoxy-4-keto-D-glucose/dTDP-3-amino-3,4,6-trideoxy-alpha-D-glucose/dTDP-2,6-dideoxy-D-kanosamine transaminase
MAYRRDRSRSLATHAQPSEHEGRSRLSAVVPCAPATIKRVVPFNDLRRGVAQDEEVRAAVLRVTNSGWYLLGEETAAFERELAHYLGVGHAVCVANGTDAIELALVALGCAPGDEIVTAANAGGYATAAGRRRSLRVRYADVDERDLLLTPRTIERALTPRTKVVVVTHLYGKMARVKAIRELCGERGIKVLEDCAQAVGARAHGVFAGGTGDAAAFSFYPTKNLGGLGDGGAIATSDEDVARSVRRLRQYGWGAKYEVEQDGGANSRLDELQAAVLRVRLGRLDRANTRRRAIAARYAEAISSSAVEMVNEDGEDYVAHLAVLRSLHRSALAERLRTQGIATAIHYPIPDHRQRVTGSRDVHLPVTETASKEVLSLPCFPELEEGEVDAICAALSKAASSLEP